MIDKIKIIETPRDGMQGISRFIPTSRKIEYIKLLLQCGFDTVEVGSFVSPRAIPQMADTEEVIEHINWEDSDSKIAVLVANLRGGEKAVHFQGVDQLFYPFSLSSTFLGLNMNTTLASAEKTIDSLLDLSGKWSKELVVFLSLAFGNPYGDEWNIDLVYEWVEKLAGKGVRKIPFAETIGNVEPDRIYDVFRQIVPAFPQIEFGFHTHTHPGMGIPKVDAAYRAGVRRFDTVMGGLGGCPMTGKEMVGNLSLEDLVAYCKQQQIDTGLKPEKLAKAERFPLLLG